MVDLASSIKAASGSHETLKCHRYILNDTLQAVLESDGKGDYYSDLSDESSAAINWYVRPSGLKRLQQISFCCWSM